MESPFVSAERTERGTVSRVRRWQVCSHARCTRLPLKSREIKKIMRSVGRRRRLSLTLSWVRDGLCKPLWFALTRDKIRQIRSDWCLLKRRNRCFTLFSPSFFSILKPLGWDNMGWYLKPTVYWPNSLSWRHISVAKCSNSFLFLFPFLLLSLSPVWFSFEHLSARFSSSWTKCFLRSSSHVQTRANSMLK